VTYTASALTRTGTAPGAWKGAELDLSELEDLDGLVDLLREQAEGAALSILFLDEDDEYVAVVRFDSADDEARMFVSDRRSLEGPGFAGRLLGEDVVVEPPEVNDEDEEESGRPEVEPGGDPALLTDLGVDADTLLGLCAEEGMLPSDVAFAVCERMGCAEVLEQVRGV
jgi:putative tRNA adenosine deaminase-associated protein